MSAPTISEETARLVRVPKGLLFPIKPTGPIILPVTTLDGDSYTLHIGGVSPLGGSPEFLCPALCFRHQRLMLKILFGRSGRFDAPEIPLVYDHLLDKKAGHPQRQMLRRTLTEIGNTWIHRVRGNKVDALRLLDYNPEIYYKPGVDISSTAERENEANIYYRRLRNVRFHEDFWRAFLNWSNCWGIRADVVDGISSDLVAACYLVLTPKAHHPDISEHNKGRKDAATLLREIGAEVPDRVSEIKRIFERERPGRYGDFSTLQLLNGHPAGDGVLRVQDTLERNVAGTGFNIRFWIQRDTPKIGDSHQDSMNEVGVLEKIWLKCGLTSEGFRAAQQPQWRRLESYVTDNLNELGYPVEKNLRFLELVRSIISPVAFDKVLGSARLAQNDEQNPIRKGMAVWLTGALRNEFSSFAERTAAHREKK